MRPFRILPAILVALLPLACVKAGPELTVTRPQSEGWSLSLHAAGPGTWELVLWHPEPFQVHGDDPVRTVLMGEKVSPAVRSALTQSFNGSERKVTTTRWEVDEARWRTGEPFQVWVKHGFVNREPFSVYREARLEVRLGSTPGSPEGLSIQVRER